MSNIQQHLFELDIFGFTIVEGALTTDEAHAMREASIPASFGLEMVTKVYTATSLFTCSTPYHLL